MGKGILQLGTDSFAGDVLDFLLRTEPTIESEVVGETQTPNIHPIENIFHLACHRLENEYIAWFKSWIFTPAYMKFDIQFNDIKEKMKPPKKLTELDRLEIRIIYLQILQELVIPEYSLINFQGILHQILINSFLDNSTIYEIPDAFKSNTQEYLNKQVIPSFIPSFRQKIEEQKIVYNQTRKRLIEKEELKKTAPKVINHISHQPLFYLVSPETLQSEKPFEKRHGELCFKLTRLKEERIETNYEFTPGIPTADKQISYQLEEMDGLKLFSYALLNKNYSCRFFLYSEMPKVDDYELTEVKNAFIYNIKNHKLYYFSKINNQIKEILTDDNKIDALRAKLQLYSLTANERSRCISNKLTLNQLNHINDIFNFFDANAIVSYTFPPQASLENFTHEDLLQFAERGHSQAEAIELAIYKHALSLKFIHIYPAEWELSWVDFYGNAHPMMTDPELLRLITKHKLQAVPDKSSAAYKELSHYLQTKSLQLLSTIQVTAIDFISPKSLKSEFIIRKDKKTLFWYDLLGREQTLTHLNSVFIDLLKPYLEGQAIDNTIKIHLINFDVKKHASNVRTKKNQIKLDACLMKNHNLNIIPFFDFDDKRVYSSLKANSFVVTLNNREWKIYYLNASKKASEFDYQGIAELESVLHECKVQIKKGGNNNESVNIKGISLAQSKRLEHLLFAHLSLTNSKQNKQIKNPAFQQASANLNNFFQSRRQNLTFIPLFDIDETKVYSLLKANSFVITWINKNWKICYVNEKNKVAEYKYQDNSEIENILQEWINTMEGENITSIAPAELSRLEKILFANIEPNNLALNKQSNHVKSKEFLEASACLLNLFQPRCSNSPTRSAHEAGSKSCAQ